MNRRIILASSSRPRRKILERAGLSFSVRAPNIDEAALAGESAAALVMRLSLAKAKAVAKMVAADYPDALIIGSDQVAELRGEIIGKPGGHDAAVAQLQKMSGATVTLYAGVALYDAAAGEAQSAVEQFQVAFRELDDDTIERYLRAEQPYDCCGSLKAEGPGIALLKKLTGDDPNTLLGLPLIKLTEMLNNAGVKLI